MNFSDESACPIADIIWNEGKHLTHGPLDGTVFHGEQCFGVCSLLGPGHSLGGQSLAPYRGDPGSSLGLVMGFGTDEVAAGQVSSKYFGFHANHHSTNCSTIAIIYNLGLIQ
jgi:hypothetical protein